MTEPLQSLARLRVLVDMAAAHDALRELQTIQEQRLADEQSARDRVRKAADAARLEAERVERDRREQAEREQQLALARIETEARIKAEQELAKAQLEADSRARMEVELATARHAVELQSIPASPSIRMPISRVAYVFAAALGIVGLALVLAITTAMDRGNTIRKRDDQIAATNERVESLTRDLAALRLDTSGKLQRAERDLAAARDDNARLTDELARLRKTSPTTTPTTRPHGSVTSPQPPPKHERLDLSHCTKGAALDCLPTK